MKLKTFETLYHVGTMNTAHKGKGSYEGSGLSVSLHPEEWRRIARLGGAPIHKLTKENNQFLDYYESMKEQGFEQKVIEWGVENGYIESATVYCVENYDEEFDRVVMGSYMDQKAAEDEYEAYEECDLTKMYARDWYVTLPKLDKRILAYGKSVLNISLLMTVYVEDQTDLDGIWWEEELDVFSYSAPRGVIVPSKISEWKMK